MEQILAYFDGIEQVIDASMTFTVGVTPCTATLTIVPQESFAAQTGTLVFFDGTNQIEWPDARVDSNSFERNASGYIWRLSVYDRRWKWQSLGGGGSISLTANQTDAYGEVIEATKKNLQELAKECLEALEESNYDIGVLPTDEYPKVLWDYELPAYALDQLCDQFGFRVVLGLDNRVRICEVGEGSELPETPNIQSNSLACQIPSVPKKVAVVCAEDRYQFDLLLEAVGLEHDTYNTIKPIDDLSYTPEVGWSSCDIAGMYEIEDIRARSLAKQSVFKYYRVQFPFKAWGFEDSLGNTNPLISYPWQIQLEQTLCEYREEDLDLPIPYRRFKPAMVGGIYFEERDYKADNNTFTTDLAPYQTDPLKPLDEEEAAELRNYEWHLGSVERYGEVLDHFIVFGSPIYCNTATTRTSIDFSKGPAKLILRAACTILDPHTNAPVRTVFEKETGSSLSTDTRYEMRPDLQVMTWYDYDNQEFTSNKEQMEQEAEYYLDGIIRGYKTTAPHTITYIGLKPIELDGAIQQITFQVGKSGALTTVNRNNEDLYRVQPLNYRKLMTRIKQNLRSAETSKKPHSLKSLR